MQHNIFFLTQFLTEASMKPVPVLEKRKISFLVEINSCSSLTVS
jgi:hypothetical protein